MPLEEKNKTKNNLNLLIDSYEIKRRPTKLTQPTEKKRKKISNISMTR